MRLNEPDWVVSIEPRGSIFGKMAHYNLVNSIIVLTTGVCIFFEGRVFINIVIFPLSSDVGLVLVSEGKRKFILQQEELNLGPRVNMWDAATLCHH